ncbi:MAG: aminomethyl-transferring glycine dehydrogenase subunit GcvPA [Spirochaetaceae bacterium]|nr:aminomethyl-transferring glycine dehydrogenase subunit GcvPA [Spirochaetaceae bacterium]
MPYIPTTPAEEQQMLATLGIKSIDDLFRDVPKSLRYPDIKLEAGKSEMEVLQEISAMAGRNANADTYKWFLGAGAYNHYVPSIIGAIASRGEFLTAYTPYQPEVAQGTLQAIFEYQSLVTSLTGMDVSNAGHYDGATALAEAAIMALKNGEGQGKKKVLIPATLHPEYIEVLKTYLAPRGAIIETYNSSPSGGGRVGVPQDLACLIAAYPDFLGEIPDDLEGLADAVHAAGALFIVHADPIMLGIFKSPGEYGADIVTAEGQSLGNDLNFGGPYLGVMAVKEALMRKMPGRIVGEAHDDQGRRGFVLTLAAREQHIRREKAVSNICSNEGLAMLRAAIYLSLMGTEGLKGVAELCWNNSHYLASIIEEKAHAKTQSRKGVFFKEFVVELPCDAELVYKKMFDKGIVAGLPLGRYYPDKKNEMLVCVTEKNTKAQMDEYAALLKAVLEEAK